MAQVSPTFAPWVAELGLQLLQVSATQARFSWPQAEQVQLRGGPGVGVTCGQAIAAVADTACVLALTGANERFRNCTTVEMSVRFMRPLTGTAEVVVDIESNGQKLAVCRVSVRGSGKVAALAMATFMYLEA